MAYGRIIHKKISVSEQVADLKSDRARLIYTWAIAHTDDVGLLPYPSRSLKAIIAPLIDISVEDFDKEWADIVDNELITHFTCGKHGYWRLTNFLKHQRLRRDRQPSTYLKDFNLETDPIKSWEKMLKIKGILENSDSEHSRRLTDGNLSGTVGMSLVCHGLPELEEKGIYNNKGLASKEAREETRKRGGGMRSIGDVIGKKV